MYQAMAVLSAATWILAHVGVACLKPSSQRRPSAATAPAAITAAAASPQIADRRMRFLRSGSKRCPATARGEYPGLPPRTAREYGLFGDDEFLEEFLGGVGADDDGIVRQEAQGLVVREDHRVVVEEDVQPPLVVPRPAVVALAVAGPRLLLLRVRAEGVELAVAAGVGAGQGIDVVEVDGVVALLEVGVVDVLAADDHVAGAEEDALVPLADHAQLVGLQQHGRAAARAEALAGRPLGQHRPDVLQVVLALEAAVGLLGLGDDRGDDADEGRDDRDDDQDLDEGEALLAAAAQTLASHGSSFAARGRRCPKCPRHASTPRGGRQDARGSGHRATGKTRRSSEGEPGPKVGDSSGPIPSAVLSRNRTEPSW